VSSDYQVFTIECPECKTQKEVYCSEVEWEEESSERESGMGPQVIHQGYWEGFCSECNKGLHVEFRQIEYPIGVEEGRSVETKNVTLVNGFCERIKPIDSSN
jgi:hypothetical protein